MPTLTVKTKKVESLNEIFKKVSSGDYESLYPIYSDDLLILKKGVLIGEKTYRGLEVKILNLYYDGEREKK